MMMTTVPACTPILPENGEFTPPFYGDYYVKVNPYSSGTGCYKIWFFSEMQRKRCLLFICRRLQSAAGTAAVDASPRPGTVCSPKPVPSARRLLQPDEPARTSTSQSRVHCSEHLASGVDRMLAECPAADARCLLHPGDRRVRLDAPDRMRFLRTSSWGRAPCVIRTRALRQ